MSIPIPKDQRGATRSEGSGPPVHLVTLDIDLWSYPYNRSPPFLRTRARPCRGCFPWQMFHLSRMTASAWLRARCVSSGCRKHLETSRSRKTMQQITSKDDWKILFGEHRGRPVWHYVIQLRSPVSLAQPCSTHSQPEKWILNLRQLLDKLLQYSTCVSVWQWKPANLFWVFFRTYINLREEKQMH